MPTFGELTPEQVCTALVPLLEHKALTTVIPWGEITDKLNALLAAHDQATLPAKLTLEDITTALDYASEGRNWCGVKPDLLGNQLNRVLARLADEVPIIHGQAELAAHDQKVREQVLEEAAQVIDQCNREGPYNAIQGASRIRALASRAEEKP